MGIFRAVYMMNKVYNTEASEHISALLACFCSLLQTYIVLARSI